MEFGLLMKTKFLYLLTFLCFSCFAEAGPMMGMLIPQTFGVNKCSDGSISAFAEGPTAWYNSALSNANDGVISGAPATIRYGSSASDGDVYNNGRGLTITFNTSLALRTLLIYGYSTHMDYTVEYWNGSSWVGMATVASPGLLLAAGRMVLQFNSNGAASSTKWRWYISNWGVSGDNTGWNFYSWEVECYL